MVRGTTALVLVRDIFVGVGIGMGFLYAPNIIVLRKGTAVGSMNKRVY